MQKLHHFVESFSGARINSWLNDSSAVIKEKSPAGFIFQKEPKFKALDLSGRKEELLSAVAVKLQGELGDAGRNCPDLPRYGCHSCRNAVYPGGSPGDSGTGKTHNKGPLHAHFTSQPLEHDTTTNQFPADLTYLRFILGETQEQVRLGSLRGTLGIEPRAAQEN